MKLGKYSPTNWLIAAMTAIVFRKINQNTHGLVEYLDERFTRLEKHMSELENKFQQVVDNDEVKATEVESNTPPAEETANLSTDLPVREAEVAQETPEPNGPEVAAGAPVSPEGEVGEVPAAPFTGETEGVVSDEPQRMVESDEADSHVVSANIARSNHH